MSRRVHPDQVALEICACGSLHVGDCEIEYARYGIGTLDKRALRPRRARTAKVCDCAFTSHESADDNFLRRCGTPIEPGQIYVEMPREHGPRDLIHLPPWTVALGCAVTYHSDLVRIGLDPDAKIGTLEKDRGEVSSAA